MPEFAEPLASDRLAKVVARVQIPLDNVAFTIEQYLLANGQRLDTETRCLLAGVRDCVGNVADETRSITRPPAADYAMTQARRVA